ncbi:MAG: 7-cyano-7-deazaguanine synthase [Candidatus Binataceae bacterium]
MKNFGVVPIRSRVAVLASGGLDSSVLLAELARRGRRVYPIYIRAGLRWERDELRVLRRFAGALNRPNVERIAVLALPMRDVAGDHWSVTGRGIPGYRARTESNYLAGRNLALLAKGAIFCARNRIGEIAMAPLRANPFPDARPEFFRAVERAAYLGLGLKLRVATPYLKLTKAKVIEKGRGLPLQFTISCARPRGAIHCGRCTKCAERVEAFRAAGISDPARYGVRQ